MINGNNILMLIVAFLTSLNYHRWTLTTCHFTPIVLYTKVDGQCNKQETIIVSQVLTERHDN